MSNRLIQGRWGAACALSALFAASGVAGAGTVRITYEFDQGTGDGFAFSVLHTPTNDRGNGSTLFRIVGTFEVIFDDVANTLEFVDFQADIVNQTNSNIKLGEISLTASSTLDLIAGPNGANDFLIGADEDDQSGNGILSLSISDDGTNISDDYEGDRSFLFLARDYNARANHFNASTYSLGLWGATEEVFGGDGHGGNTDIDDTSLGMDVFGDIVSIPLPTGAGLAACGIAALASVRRRR